MKGYRVFDSTSFCVSLWSLCFLALALPSKAFAHGGEGVIYGVVDIQKIKREIPEGVKLGELLATKIAESEKKVAEMKKNLQSLGMQLERDANVMGDGVKESIARQQLASIRAIRREQNSVRNTLIIMNEVQGKKLKEKIIQYVNEVAFKKGVFMVMEVSVSGLLFIKDDHSIDLTDAVIEHAKNSQS